MLEEYAVVDLLDMLGYLGFSALAVQEERSFFEAGKRIGSDLVTIVDDGYDPAGLPLWFDYEGVAKQRVELVERGICREVVYDAQTAARDGVASTGHGLPAPNPWGPFPLNMFMEPGDATREDLIGGLDRGLLVTRFHYTNPVHPKLAIVTGMTRDGTFLVEDGKIVGPVKNLRYTQSYLAALAGTVAVARERKTLKGFLGGVVVPAVRIEGWTFTGGTSTGPSQAALRPARREGFETFTGPRPRSQETLRKLRERRGNASPRPHRRPRPSGDRHDRFDHPSPATGADLRALPDPSDPRATAEAILFEIRRVIVGQDAMLERILVGLLSGGHLLLEGVPGLAKTLTIKTLADVLGGSFKRIQFTPDLMPSDLVGTRIYRPDKGSLRRRAGPRLRELPARRRDQPRPGQGPVGAARGDAGAPGHDRPRHVQGADPFLVLATENPIEAEGTYPLPEAQVDRFMLKILLDYPNPADEAQIVARSLVPAAPPREILDADGLLRLQRTVTEVYVDPRLISYAVALVEATRKLTYWGAPTSRPTSRTAPARAARSTSSTAPARWPSSTAAATSCRPTSSPWRPTSCATGWS